MTRELRLALPIAAAIDVGDGQAREFCLGDATQATQVDSIHLSDGRLGPNAERTHTTVLAEVVLVLPCVEQVLSELALASGEAKAPFACHSWPEACLTADGTVAAIGTLREVEIGLELDCAAVATALVRLQHAFAPKKL